MAQSRRSLSGTAPTSRWPHARRSVRRYSVSPALLSISAVILGAGLVGCQPIELEPERIIRDLPGPVYVERQPQRPLPPPPPAPRKTITNRIIVVDPGHGGRDPGAMAKYRGHMREKDINLDVARHVSSVLASQGGRVILTRNGDTTVDLNARARAADRYRADLFLSIHADSSPKRYISGTGIHIYTRANYETMRMAQCIAASFRRNGIECRGIFRNNFHVLREHKRPGILIECGFLTNASDSERLNDASYRQKLANAIAQGVVDHFAQ